MKTLLRLLLKSQHQRNRSGPDQTDKGMTLVELLVGSIMAFLIITPMLAFVVDMLNTDRREQVKSNTEQDVQAALDFIAQDLSQALYIYDNTPATGIPALIGNFLPQNQNETPILVFWKRELIKNSMPVDLEETPQPNDCTAPTPTGANTNCNDTYVLALVAYYQVSEPNAIWCQPSGAPCPTRIVRYQIKDGLRDPNSVDPDPSNRYFAGHEPSPAFDPSFNLSNPTQNVTRGQNWDAPEVLVNYIDHSEKPIGSEECKNALGKPTTQTGTTTVEIPEESLRVTNYIPPTPNITQGFYACVDTARNIARVTIRGNSLRRIQTDDVDYDANKVAYFPTASVQVKGLGARGK